MTTQPKDPKPRITWKDAPRMTHGLFKPVSYILAERKLCGGQTLVLTFTPNKWEAYTTHIETSPDNFVSGFYTHDLLTAVESFKKRL